MPKEEAKKETPQLVTAVEVTLKCKDKATAESLKVFSTDKYSEAKKEIKFTKYTSTKDKSFRLVHDGEKVLMFFESDGETHTAHQLFIGTKEDCEKEIDKLGLRRK